MSMGWMDHMRDAVYLALCAAFSMDPEADASLSRFAPAYYENATNPQATRDTNICYYALSEEETPGTDYIQVQYCGPGARIKKTIPVMALLTFYGPNADDDAETFWSMVQFDAGAISPRGVLRSKNVVLNGTPGRPVAVYESEGTYHRRRCDVRLRLAYLETKDQAIGLVEVPPEITTVTNI